MLKDKHDYFEKEGEQFNQIVGEFLSGNYPAQPWTVVPFGKLARVWLDFSKSGKVSDEFALDQIEKQLQENAFRLQFNTIVAGHENIDPTMFLESHFGELIDKATLTRLVAWAIELPTGGWRISDYGVSKVLKALELAYSAETPETKLKHLDAALNVVHQRSDLAAWFVEGGSNSLSKLALN